MSSYDTHYRFPREKIFGVQETEEHGVAAEPILLTIRGQGTFIFKSKRHLNSEAAGGPRSIRSLRVAFNTSPPATEGQTGQDVGTELFYLFIHDDKAVTELSVEGAVVKRDASGVMRGNYAFYWISLDFFPCDSDARYEEVCIRFGRGEARLETEVFQYRKFVLKNSAFRQLSQVSVSEWVQPMRVLRDPVVDTVPLMVKNTDSLTMEDVAANKAMPKAALSTVGQKLYDIVAGGIFVLDTPDFPNFSDAIKRSIESGNGWCYQMLKKKATEFGSNPNEVYLRITLGKAGGESPGIPFVMEIWPPQCFSPIHQHAGANAIIRVLSGEIGVSLFPFLDTGTALSNQVEVTPFAKASFTKDQITWISPLLNQTHQLRNNAAKGGLPCITIQCYMYDETDTGHYPFFDYVDDDGTVHQFTPNSDMDFLEFKEIMQKEWNEPMFENPIASLESLTTFS